MSKFKFKQLWSVVGLPFLVTRLGLLLITWFSPYLAVSSSYPLAAVVERGYHFFNRPMLDSWIRWDSGWYLQIINQGYHSAQSWAFFPLYPALIKAFSLAIPVWGDLDQVKLIIGLILSNIFFSGRVVVFIPIGGAVNSFSQSS